MLLFLSPFTFHELRRRGVPFPRLCVRLSPERHPPERRPQMQGERQSAWRIQGQEQQGIETVRYLEQMRSPGLPSTPRKPGRAFWRQLCCLPGARLRPQGRGLGSPLTWAVRSPPRTRRPPTEAARAWSRWSPAGRRPAPPSLLPLPPPPRTRTLLLQRRPPSCFPPLRRPPLRGPLRGAAPCPSLWASPQPARERCTWCPAWRPRPSRSPWTTAVAAAQQTAAPGAATGAATALPSPWLFQRRRRSRAYLGQHPPGSPPPPCPAGRPSPSGERTLSPRTAPHGCPPEREQGRPAPKGGRAAGGAGGCRQGVHLARSVCVPCRLDR